MLLIAKTIARQSGALKYQPTLFTKQVFYPQISQRSQIIISRAFSVGEKPMMYRNDRSYLYGKLKDIGSINPSILTLEQLVEIVAIYKQAITHEKTPAAQEKIRNKIVEYEFYIDMRNDRAIPF